MSSTDTSRNRPLDVVNLALVDVNGAVKPYLNVFLYVRQDWDDSLVGLVGTISGLFAIAVQTPAGALIDRTRDKRFALLAALVVLSFGATLFGISPEFWPVLIGSCLVASVAYVTKPIVAAVSLLVTPRGAVTKRLGRNSAFERGGNAAIALAIGAVGWVLPDRAVFLLVPALCVVVTAALFSIRRSRLDLSRLREHDRETSFWSVLTSSRPLLVFAIGIGLYAFARSPMLTLVGQEISKGHPHWSSTVISVCIIGAQALMVPMAILVGHRADRWGRKPLLLTSFAAITTQAALFALWHNPFWLVGVQLLDGVANGLLSALKPLVTADIMKGTGHYNLALGIIGTLQSIGSALSFVVAGSLVQHAGFSAAYIALGAVAFAALALFCFALPESRRDDEDTR